MGKITDQPAATLPLAGTELLTIIQSGENRQTTADAVNFTRPPIPHADTHAQGGTDEITPISIDAADRIHDHTLAEITDSGTAAGYNVGLNIGELVELIDVDTMGKPGLPEIDGSKLTGLGPGQTNLSVPQGEITAIDLAVRSDTGTDARIPGATATTAGLMIRDDFNKLAGVEAGATANSTDAELLNRANHTGQQDSQTVTVAAGERLLGRYNTGSGVSELIQLGANLSFNGNVLDAASAGALGDLSDVLLTGPTIDQVLLYDGTRWVNQTIDLSGSGTVTSVGSGQGLSGGPITTAGTLNVQLESGEGLYFGAGGGVGIFRTTVDSWYMAAGSAYTISDSDQLFLKKAEASSTYALKSDTYTKAETYSQAEVDANFAPKLISSLPALP